MNVTLLGKCKTVILEAPIIVLQLFGKVTAAALSEASSVSNGTPFELIRKP